MTLKSLFTVLETLHRTSVHKKRKQKTVVLIVYGCKPSVFNSSRNFRPVIFYSIFSECIQFATLFHNRMRNCTLFDCVCTWFICLENFTLKKLKWLMQNGCRWKKIRVAQARLFCAFSFLPNYPFISFSWRNHEKKPNANQKLENMAAFRSIMPWYRFDLLV